MLSGCYTSASRVVLLATLVGVALPNIVVAIPSHEYHPSSLTINGANITGLDRIARLKARYGGGENLLELAAACSTDGLDEVVFLTVDSTAWIAYGRHVRLYAQDIGRIRAAYAGRDGVQVILIDDENRQQNLRTPVGVVMAAGLAGIVFIGVAIGGLTGLRARRNLAAIGRRDPMWDHVLYGLVIGMSGALLIYGMSDRQLHLGDISPVSPGTHLHQFMHIPPQQQTLVSPPHRGRAGGTPQQPALGDACSTPFSRASAAGAEAARQAPPEVPCS
jgi:hypothetical protein